MKTPDEIKKGLGCVLAGFNDSCSLVCATCEFYNPGYNIKKRMEDTLDYIQQLEAKDVEQVHRIAELEKELAAVKQERDAAVADLDNNNQCYICAHVDCWDEDPCFSCIHSNPIDNFASHFEWRGVCPENTEVQEDG